MIQKEAVQFTASFIFMDYNKSFRNQKRKFWLKPMEFCYKINGLKPVSIE